MTGAARRITVTFFLACAALAAVATPLCAAEVRWRRARTENFELYTPRADAAARRLLARLEQAHEFFRNVFELKPAHGLPTRVVIFSSEEEYRKIQPSEYAHGFYLRGFRRDWIVVRDLGPHVIEAALHEYTHLVIRRFEGEFPLWLNEGHADFYSTLRPSRDRVEAGHPIPARKLTLSVYDWLPLEDVLAAESIQHIGGQAEVELFYAQSWLLTHMLNVSESYSGKFLDFMKAVNGGVPSEEAFRTVYGKSIEEVERDLRNYIRTPLRHAVFRVQVPEDVTVSEPEAASQFEADLIYASLMVSVNRRIRAAAVYAQLDAAGADCRWESELGYLAWAAGLAADAAGHFRKAVECGDRSPGLLQDLEMALSVQ